jgi:hypothetical protein
MHITSKNSNRKPIIASSVAIVLLLISAFLYVYGLNGNLFGWNNHQDESINYNQPTDEQKEAGKNAKQITTDNSNSSIKQNSGGSDQPSAPQEQPDGTKSTVDITVTSSVQNNDTFQIRTLIGVVDNTGTCTLNLSKSTTTISKTSGVQALSSTSTCKGFDIPVAELSAGEWIATINYDNASLTGSTKKNITIK